MSSGESIAAGTLLVVTAALTVLLAALSGLGVTGMGAGAYTIAAGGGDPVVIGVFSVMGLIGLLLVICAFVGAAVTGWAGFRVLSDDPRPLRAGAYTGVVTSALWTASTCVMPLSAVWALPLVLALIALGLALQSPPPTTGRSW